MGNFTRREVRLACEFARDMVGNHAPDLIGKREAWEIFKDDIHGKLGEVAVEKYIQEKLSDCVINSGVDYTIMPRGQWDITDLVVNNKSLNVKAVGEYSSYLMIECFRYDDQGNYSYRNHNNEVIQVDGYVLVRVIIKPEIDETDFNNRNDETFMELLAQRNSKRTIQYEILGAIDHQNFWGIKKYAPEGMKCTGPNLWKIASGNSEDIEMAEDGDNIPKNMRLQKDNYIVHKSKLNPLEKMLK